VSAQARCRRDRESSQSREPGKHDLNVQASDRQNNGVEDEPECQLSWTANFRPTIVPTLTHNSSKNNVAWIDERRGWGYSQRRYRIWSPTPTRGPARQPRASALTCAAPRTLPRNPSRIHCPRRGFAPRPAAALRRKRFTSTRNEPLEAYESFEDRSGDHAQS
jgi:hypothetical protein